jgi:predicted  nucleic acid-binding Zn-ribbon protein
MSDQENSGPDNSDDDDRTMSTKIDDMEERMDVQDEDIQALREDLEDQMDVLDSRIREIESGAADVESARKLFDYILDVEEQISTLRDRLEAAIQEGTQD